MSTRTKSSLAVLEEKMFGKRKMPVKKSASGLCEKTDPRYCSIAIRAIDGCQVYVCHHCATIIDGPGTTYYDAYDIKRKRNDLDEVGPNSCSVAILRKICRPCYRKCSVPI